MSHDGTELATKEDIRMIMSKLDDVATKMATKTELEKTKIELTEHIAGVEQRLTHRINSLDEDLMATMSDTVHIRRHVGMSVGEE
jgi:hypothetical protein